MQTGVQIYTSNRLEDLLTVLAAQLQHEPLPPLQSETIIVPGQGIARWLRFELATQHGIAAGLELPFPGAFLQQLGRKLGGSARDLFAADVLTLRIHRLLADPKRQQELGLAARYCEHDPDGRKRMQLSQRLAACFDDYQLYRADLLTRAAAGDDLTEQGDHGPWQARLWRALLEDAGLRAGRSARKAKPTTATPTLFSALAEPEGADNTSAHRLQALEQLLADPERRRAALPPRLSVFAAATLPPALLKLLFGIGEHVPVRLYVPTPSPHYFGDQRRPDGNRPADDGNALLQRLGTEAREFQDLLLDLQDYGAGVVVERSDLTDPKDQTPRHLLHCLQQDLTLVREHGSASLPAYPIADGDSSLRVHDCHSEHRELEVVRDQILAAFADDSELQPHDVLVLVPDIERYAPYVHAVFGPVQQHLPFAVADKSPAAERPVCAALFRVLRLAQSRIHVYDVLHLLETPAVQRRFGLFQSDLPVLRHLCERAGIRWGIDGASRERRFGVPSFEDNSWRTGIESMLLGVATGPVPDLVHGWLPSADVTSSREPLLERFGHFLDVLLPLLRPLQRARPLGDWALQLEEIAAALFAPDADDEAGLQTLRSACAQLRHAADDARHTDLIAPIVLDDWLQTALGRGASGQGFLGGKVTIAAMLPMRAVPVRCLFVCGLDDRSFPRRDQPAPFDLGQNPRRRGDRSPRLDDRQLFLDCLLAARDQLHLTYIGHSVKDDSECAPSVVLAELIDCVERCCAPPTPFPSARDWLVVRHPLQAWSPRYRRGDDPRLFTFSTAQDSERAVASVDEPPWFTTPVAAPETAAANVIELDALLAFWWHPCRTFLQQALGIRLPRAGEEAPQTEIFQLSALDQWRLLDTLVTRATDDRPPPHDALALTRASGLLPVGGAGAVVYAWSDEESQQFVGELDRLGALASRPITCRGDDFAIRGELPQVGSEFVVYARASKCKPKDRLRAWVLHVVAATARLQGAALPPRTMLLMRDANLGYCELDAAAATAALSDLVAGYRQGLTAPLPVYENSSHAYGKEQHERKTDDAGAMRKARAKWVHDPYTDYANQDSEDDAIALCTRGTDPLAAPAFADWATRLWRTIYGHTEKLS